MQTDATTPNNVETCSATSEEYNQWDFVSKPCEWPKQCRKRCAIGSNIVPLPFGNRGTKEMLGVVGLKVWPGVNLIKLLHLYVFQLYTVHVKSHLWIHGFNKGNFDAGINSCSTGQTTSVDYTCKFRTQRTCSDKYVAKVDRVIWACDHGFGKVAVNVCVFVLIWWVDKNVGSVNRSCHTGKASLLLCLWISRQQPWEGVQTIEWNLALGLILQGQHDEWFATLLKWRLHDKSA